METEPKKKNRVIAVGNQKGGVAKTTLTVQLAAALAERGNKCLVWDLDMNSGASKHFGIKDSMRLLGTFEVLLGKEDPEDVIVREGELENVLLPPNLDLLPARRNLELIDSAIAAELGPMFERGSVLLAPLKTLSNKYDYIFLDTGPNLMVPTVAAYKGAGYFLLSAAPESFAVQGLTDALKDIRSAQINGNPNLVLIGVVLQAVPGRQTKLSRKLIGFVKRTFSEVPYWMKPYETTISHSTVVGTAQDGGKTVFQTEPKHKITEQYRMLAEEVETRIDKLEQERGAALAPLPKPVDIDIETHSGNDNEKVAANG